MPIDFFWCLISSHLPSPAPPRRGAPHVLVMACNCTHASKFQVATFCAYRESYRPPLAPRALVTLHCFGLPVVARFSFLLSLDCTVRVVLLGTPSLAPPAFASTGVPYSIYIALCTACRRTTVQYSKRSRETCVQRGVSISVDAEIPTCIKRSRTFPYF